LFVKRIDGAFRGFIFLKRFREFRRSGKQKTTQRFTVLLPKRRESGNDEGAAETSAPFSCCFSYGFMRFRRFVFPAASYQCV